MTFNNVDNNAVDTTDAFKIPGVSLGGKLNFAAHLFKGMRQSSRVKEDSCRRNGPPL